jgi:hypothetical protein
MRTDETTLARNLARIIKKLLTDSKTELLKVEFSEAYGFARLYTKDMKAICEVSQMDGKSLAKLLDVPFVIIKRR